MPILKAGAASTTFDLDGKEYSKGLYEATYSDVITLADGSSDESKLTIGLRNINAGEPIQEPVMIRAWKNGSQTPYTTLDALISDLSSVAGIGSSSSVSVATSYPTTDITKVGKTFLYKGTQWVYLTQDMINDRGWQNIDAVSVGFPAPLEDNRTNYKVIRPTESAWNLVGTADLEASYYTYRNATGGDIEFDAIGYASPHLLRNLSVTVSAGNTLIKIRNIGLMVNIQDEGTSSAMIATGKDMSAETIDDVFTQLPATTKTATIDVRFNPGSATCDTSIATAKGYTVVTT